MSLLMTEKNGTSYNDAAAVTAAAADSMVMIMMMIIIITWKVNYCSLFKIGS